LREYTSEEKFDEVSDTDVCMLWFHEHRVMQNIFQRVDELIDKGELLRELDLSALPDLYDRFVKLIECLVITL
jgi:callose synthase